VWLYPLTPVFYLPAMTSILAVAFLNSPWTSLVAIAPVLAGLPAAQIVGLGERGASEEKGVGDA
jgi:hypothetical protein